MTVTPEQLADLEREARDAASSPDPQVRRWGTAELAVLAALRDAEAELAAIRAREEEVGTDEGWHIGGAWGDYGEVVVPLRILSYVIGGELDQKVVSTDPGYAATFAEQVARAERAEAERDAWHEVARRATRRARHDREDAQQDSALRERAEATIARVRAAAKRWESGGRAQRPLVLMGKALHRHLDGTEKKSTP